MFIFTHCVHICFATAEAGSLSAHDANWILGRDFILVGRHEAPSGLLVNGEVFRKQCHAVLTFPGQVPASGSY